MKKNWLSRLFCKHEYMPFTKYSKFQNIRGDRIYFVCNKCGNEKKENIFYEFEGNGYK